MSSSFAQRWWTEIRNPDRWDGAGVAFTTIDQFFGGLAELQKKAAQGLLASIDECRAYARSYEGYYKALTRVNAAVASEFPTLTAAEQKVFASLRVQENQLKFTVERLSQAANSSGDLASVRTLIASNAVQAGRALGAFVGIAQILQQVNDGSLDDVGKVSVGVLAGYGAGVAFANIGFVTTAAASGPLGWLVAAGVIAVGGYVGQKSAEALWVQIVSSDGEQLRRQLISQAAQIFGEDDPLTLEIRTQLQYSADKLGKLDGTWLTGFTELTFSEKAYLTFLLFAPGGARFSEAYIGDMHSLFQANFSAGQLAVRDKLLGAVSRIAVTNASYETRLVETNEASVSVNLEGFAGSLSAVRDYVTTQLSEFDQRGWALTGPERVVIALAAGTHAASAKDSLLIGSAGVDGLIGGAGHDDLVGGAGQDTLLGMGGTDDLFGGADDDLLDGGAGGDRLYGGTGNDTYQLKKGELGDTIFDEDGNGTITIDGQALTGGKKVDDNYWLSDDKQWGYLLSANGDLTISNGTSPDKITIRGWKNGGGNQLGIVLSDEQAEKDPEPTYHTYLGDQRAPVGTDADGKPYYQWGSTSGYDAQGTLIGGVAEEGFADVIYGSSTDPNKIQGLGGNDVLAGGAGKDQIEGGDGDDLIAGGLGSDTIKGGAGDDRIHSAGSLYVPGRYRPGEEAPDYWNSEQWREDNKGGYLPPSNATSVTGMTNWGTYIPQGETTTLIWGVSLNTSQGGSSQAGDSVDGGGGDDIVIGSDANDRLQGGAGDDGIAGAGGDDIVEGGEGADRLGGDGGTVYQNTEGYYRFDYTPASQHGADFMDGGAGDDSVTGGGGADNLFGGAGNDLIVGDSLASNEDTSGAYIPLDYHGSDYLDGEDGDDSSTRCRKRKHKPNRSISSLKSALSPRIWYAGCYQNYSERKQTRRQPPFPWANSSANRNNCLRRRTPRPWNRRNSSASSSSTAQKYDSGTPSTRARCVAVNTSGVCLPRSYLGDRTADANGATITLVEGQTQMSFALVQEGKLSADGNRTDSCSERKRAAKAMRSFDFGGAV